jgi:hypothetical protein
MERWAPERSHQTIFVSLLGRGASLADEGEPGAGGVAEVDDDDGVFGKLRLPFDGGSGVDEFGSREVADEHRVLETFPVLFHCFAYLA